MLLPLYSFSEHPHSFKLTTFAQLPLTPVAQTTILPQLLSDRLDRQSPNSTSQSLFSALALSLASHSHFKHKVTEGRATWERSRKVELQRRTNVSPCRARSYRNNNQHIIRATGLERLP